MDDNSIVDRLVGRRVCLNCSSVYHVKFNPTRIDGFCDKCGGNLIQRSDDKEDVIRSRLEVYKKSVDTLSTFYTKMGKFCEIDGRGTADEVYHRLVESLK